MKGKSTKFFEDFDLQLSPPTVDRLARYIRDGLAGEDGRFLPDVAKAELMNFAAELEIRTQERARGSVHWVQHGDVCSPSHPMHGVGPGWRCPCYPEPVSKEPVRRSHRGITRDWNRVCTDNDCWCWGSEHHNPRPKDDSWLD